MKEVGDGGNRVPTVGEQRGLEGGLENRSSVRREEGGGICRESESQSLSRGSIDVALQGEEHAIVGEGHLLPLEALDQLVSEKGR